MDKKTRVYFQNCMDICELINIKILINYNNLEPAKIKKQYEMLCEHLYV